MSQPQLTKEARFTLEALEVAVVMSMKAAEGDLDASLEVMVYDSLGGAFTLDLTDVIDGVPTGIVIYDTRDAISVENYGKGCSIAEALVKLVRWMDDPELSIWAFGPDTL